MKEQDMKTWVDRGEMPQVRGGGDGIAIAPDG
jgi:hypothetical protein